jgi:hypothetical protein
VTNRPLTNDQEVTGVTRRSRQRSGESIDQWSVVLSKKNLDKPI